jgi:hypothetical protein
MFIAQATGFQKYSEPTKEVTLLLSAYLTLLANTIKTFTAVIVAEL